MGRLDVFINMPFESKGRYRHLLIAYVAGLAGLGFTARCVLEIVPRPNRVDRLVELLRQCPTSIHDLSCVRATAGAPRFNMPFELGLVAANRRMRWFVFESKAFRLQRTLSDINGHDPMIHDGNAATALARLRDIFGNARRATTTDELLGLHRDAKKLARRIEAREGGSLLTRSAFIDLVVGSKELAARRGLI